MKLETSNENAIRSETLDSCQEGAEQSHEKTPGSKGVVAVSMIPASIAQQM